MTRHNEWAATAPHIIYKAYPDCDLLPIEPPQPGETIRQFKLRAEDVGDTLFLFLCREADDEIDARDYVTRLDRAIRDVQSVQIAFEASLAPDPRITKLGKREATIRLTLGADWIELTLGDVDAHGRRSGNVTSSLHTSEQHGDPFNAAIDAIESLVLAHACAGLDVTDPRYVEGICTCLDACANHLPGGDAS